MNTKIPLPRATPTPLYDALINMGREDDASEYHACSDSTIARPNNVITNQVSLKSEAKPRYDENQDSNYRPHCKTHGELAPSI